MEPQADPLRKLHEFGGPQLVIELRLAGKNDAQGFVFGRLDSGEQADFFKHAVRQVLRLINDQQYLAAGGVLFDKEVADGGEEFGLLHLERGEAELSEKRLQESDRGQLRLVDLGDDHVLVDLAQERLDQRRLARADLTRDHDEAVGEPHGRFHVGLGAGVVF